MSEPFATLKKDNLEDSKMSPLQKSTLVRARGLSRAGLRRTKDSELKISNGASAIHSHISRAPRVASGTEKEKQILRGQKAAFFEY